jgi:hypothetical protein
MTDLATLGLAIDSSQTAPAINKLDGLTAAAARTEKAVDSLADASKSAQAATAKVGGEAAKATSAITSTAEALDSQAKSTKRATDSLRGYSGALLDMLRSQQAGMNFHMDLNSSFGLDESIRKSVRASAIVFAAEMDRLDEIAALKAQQAGQSFAESLEQRLISGTGKSAREAASVFGAELDRMEDIAHLKAAQIGAAFQSDLNASFGIGANSGSARASAEIFEAAAREADQMAAKATTLRAALNPLGAAQDALNAELKEYAVLAERGAITTQELVAAQAMAKTRFDQTAASLTSGSKLASFELRNLKFQMIDIAQSIPMAFQSPLYFLQNLGFQFAQIGQIFMGQGGLKTGIREMGTILGGVASGVANVAGRFANLGLVVGGAVTGFLAIRDAASQAEQRSVGFGETFTAIFQVIGRYLSNSLLGSAFEKIVSGVSYAFGKLKSAATDLAEWIINAFRAVGSDMAFIWNNFPTIVEAAAVGAANALVSKMEGAINKIADAINRLNNAFGGVLPQIEHVDLGRFANPAAFDLAAKNAEHMKDVINILNSTPLRDLGKEIVDQIQTNHALEGLDALGEVDFTKTVGGINSIGSGLGQVGKQASGVTVQFGGMAQQAVNVSKLFQEAKQQQLTGLLASEQQLRSLKTQAEDLQKTLSAAGSESVDKVFGKEFTGNAQSASEAIAQATATVDKIFHAFDEGRMSISDTNSALDLVRQTLQQFGGDSKSVDAFLNKIINGQLQARILKSNVDSLSQSIKAIPNKTVTITIKTQRVGSGTQSLYDVGKEDGSGSTTVGVTRYGDGAGPSITANQVPSSYTGGEGAGTGSSYGGGGSSTVNVWRFATGGMIHPGDTQRVSFFKSPDETVGIFTPQQMNALAGGAQTLGPAETSATDKLSLAITDTAANTKKTAQILDDIKTNSGSSAFGGSSYSNSSGADTSQQDQLSAQYAKVLQQIRSNFRAAGIVGRGIIGYGLDGLAATPEQIARNIVYGGAQSVAGFASGGMIGGDAGDTQKVEFFKNPNERVIIARPDQFEDVRSQTSTNAGDQRPIVFHMPITVQGGAQVSNDSIAELKRQFALQLREGLRSINGR